MIPQGISTTPGRGTVGAGKLKQDVKRSHLQPQTTTQSKLEVGEATNSQNALSRMYVFQQRRIGKRFTRYMPGRGIDSRIYNEKKKLHTKKRNSLVFLKIINKYININKICN